MTADALVSRQLGPLRSHESQAQWTLQSIAQTEEAYKEKHGKYGALEDVAHWRQESIREAVKRAHEANADTEYMAYATFDPKVEGYDVRLNNSGDKFEVIATPTVYRKTGRRSFYIDQTGVLRAADVGGKPADANAPPVD